MNEPKPLHLRFKDAFSGIVFGFEESNFRIQCVAAAFALLLLAILQPQLLWWAIALQMIGSVIGLELLNTALESLADAVEPQKHPLIKRAKDCAAGAVLIQAMISLSVAGFLLYESLQH